MQVIETGLPGLLLLQPQVHQDARGTFQESWNVRTFHAATGLAPSFVQDNHTQSRRGVLRGLHYQVGVPQAKLVRVVHGEVLDVAVDLRRASPTFGRWHAVRLSADDALQLWIPGGFAHGFRVLGEGSADLLYKVTAHRVAEAERCIAWNDPTLAVDWMLDGGTPLVSERDAQGLRFPDAPCFD